MTSPPLTIGPNAPLSLARSLMRVHGIRHLPVTDLGRLVGLVSERELDLLEVSSDVDLRALTVDRAMVRHPYTAEPEAPLHLVAQEMAERKADSAVVLRCGEVVGLFTISDALRALAFVVQAGVPEEVLDADADPLPAAVCLR